LTFSQASHEGYGSTARIEDDPKCRLRLLILKPTGTLSDPMGEGEVIVRL